MFACAIRRSDGLQMGWSMQLAASEGSDHEGHEELQLPRGNSLRGYALKAPGCVNPKKKGRPIEALCGRDVLRDLRALRGRFLVSVIQLVGGLNCSCWVSSHDLWYD